MNGPLDSLHPLEGDELQLTIPMLPNMELVAADLAGSLGAALGFTRHRVDEIRLAVIEACLNSFEHSQAAERRVWLTFRLHRSALEIQICDRGEGFDPGEVPPPDIRKNMTGERKRGWGLKIMSTLMDSAEILSTSEGTAVILIKSLHEETRDEAV